MTSSPVRLATVLLVDRRGWVLLQERDEYAPRAANQWGMVGGHVEDGEDFEPAAYRELEEETGVVLPPGTLRLWRDEEYTYPDGHHGHYRIYVAAADLTDADIVLGEGRQIVYVDPRRVHDLPMSGSGAHFVPAFLADPVRASLQAELGSTPG
jgi:8-oxo-dGTP diphosphatase